MRVDAARVTGIAGCPLTSEGSRKNTTTTPANPRLISAMSPLRQATRMTARANRMASQIIAEPRSYP